MNALYAQFQTAVATILNHADELRLTFTKSEVEGQISVLICAPASTTSYQSSAKELAALASTPVAFSGSYDEVFHEVLPCLAEELGTVAKETRSALEKVEALKAATRAAASKLGGKNGKEAKDSKPAPAVAATPQVPDLFSEFGSAPEVESEPDTTTDNELSHDNLDQE